MALSTTMAGNSHDREGHYRTIPAISISSWPRSQLTRRGRPTCLLVVLTFAVVSRNEHERIAGKGCLRPSPRSRIRKRVVYPVQLSAGAAAGHRNIVHRSSEKVGLRNMPKSTRRKSPPQKRAAQPNRAQIRAAQVREEQSAARITMLDATSSNPNTDDMSGGQDATTPTVVARPKSRVRLSRSSRGDTRTVVMDRSSSSTNLTRAQEYAFVRADLPPLALHRWLDPYRDDRLAPGDRLLVARGVFDGLAGLTRVPS